MAKDFFAFNISILTLAGLWPASFREQKYVFRPLIRTVYNGFCFCFCVLFYTGGELYGTYAMADGDIRATVKRLSWAATHTVTAAKVMIWFKRRKLVMHLMEALRTRATALQEDRHEDFDPASIFAAAGARNYRYVSIYFWVGFLVPVNACMGALYSFFFDPGALDIAADGTGWIPFAINTRAHCLFAIGLQGVAVVYCGFQIISLDSVATSTVHYLTAHVQVLQQAFRTLHARAVAKLDHPVTKDELDSWIIDPPPLRRLARLEMNKCLRHLQEIVHVAKELEKVYHMQTLLQVLVTLFVFCTCLFLVSKTPMTSKSFVGEVTYMVAIQIQLSMYCWFGNELTLASAEIPAALYDGDWLSTDESYKRSMLITMTRFRRPILLTVGKFSPLTLNTLVTIFRGSYSFFAVLKNVEL